MIKCVTNILLAIIIVLTVACFTQTIRLDKISKDRDVALSNISCLMDTMEVLKNDTSIQAYRISQLSMTIDNYNSRNSKEIKGLKSLGIKTDELKSISKQSLKIQAHISSGISNNDSSKVIKFDNGCIKVQGEIYKDTIIQDIITSVNLRQIVYKVPKHKFLWWHWGVKAIKQVITTDNPYAHLEYAEYIELTK